MLQQQNLALLKRSRPIRAQFFVCWMAEDQWEPGRAWVGQEVESFEIEGVLLWPDANENLLEPSQLPALLPSCHHEDFPTGIILYQSQDIPWKEADTISLMFQSTLPIRDKNYFGCDLYIKLNISLTSLYLFQNLSLSSLNLEKFC